MSDDRAGMASLLRQAGEAIAAIEDTDFGSEDQGCAVDDLVDLARKIERLHDRTLTY